MTSTDAAAGSGRAIKPISVDRAGLILESRGVDMTLANLRFRFWSVWLRWHRACKRGR